MAALWPTTPAMMRLRCAAARSVTLAGVRPLTRSRSVAKLAAAICTAELAEGSISKAAGPPLRIRGKLPRPPWAQTDAGPVQAKAAGVTSRSVVAMQAGNFMACESYPCAPLFAITCVPAGPSRCHAWCMKHALRRFVIAFTLLTVTGISMANTTLLYIGTQDPAKMGIAVAEFDPDTGTLSAPKLVQETRDPAHFTLSADGRRLYLCNTGTPGGVSAFAVENRNTGAL